MTAAAAGFLVAQCAFIVFGLPIAFVPPVRSFSLAGRLAAAFVTGALVYTVFATVLSLFALEWSVAVLAIPLTLLSAVASLLLARANGASPRVREPWGVIDGVAIAVIGVALLHVFAAFATTRASSTDYIFFWGVKALLFAQHGGIDAELLASPRMLHLHTNYPPLVPLTTGWSVLVTGKMSWRFGLVTSALWFAAAIPLVIELLKTRLGASQARVGGAVWSVALGSSLVYSMSAGNGEAPLLAYETLAVGAMLVRDRGARLVLMSIGLAGTLLTKNEGMIAFVIILAAYMFGLLLERERVTVRELLLLVAIPLAAFSTWLLFEDVYGVPMTDATRETLSGFTLRYTPTIVRESIRNLSAGTWGVAWLVALAALVTGRSAFRLSAPPVVAGLATIAVFIGYYFLHWTDPAQWIEWTLPRLAQPALSMLLLGGALAFFAPPGERVPASKD